MKDSQSPQNRHPRSSSTSNLSALCCHTTSAQSLPNYANKQYTPMFVVTARGLEVVRAVGTLLKAAAGVGLERRGAHIRRIVSVTVVQDQPLELEVALDTRNPVLVPGHGLLDLAHGPDHVLHHKVSLAIVLGLALAHVPGLVRHIPVGVDAHIRADPEAARTLQDTLDPDPTIQLLPFKLAAKTQETAQNA
ncbi:hypothetical protein X801_03152 [Opisthorchis viverrini]|uniref:Uncharacterized protein n=1 Tax=Opisthorchis viverrini TaxID=6198 RepID=A0A1S8X2Q3_OPIVI|nr:hypothetical protein X801_03152 [Opisthorchis viverrini]